MKIKTFLFLLLLGTITVSLICNCKKETTNNPIFSVSTDPAVVITSTSVICSGGIHSESFDLNAIYGTVGFCWSITNHVPTANDQYIVTGVFKLGGFSYQLNDLNLGTTYYVRSFADTNRGWTFGNVISITTL